MYRFGGGNRYCAPPRFIGQHLTAKADASSVTLYDQQGAEIIRYARCWRRGRTLGGERFQKELLDHQPAALRSEAQQRLLKRFQGVCPVETVKLRSPQLRPSATLHRESGNPSCRACGP
jgi:hypothetical protein